MKENILQQAEKSIIELADNFKKLKENQFIYGQENHPKRIKKTVQMPDYMKSYNSAHIFGEIAYAAEGKCIFNIEKTNYLVEKGDLCFVNYGNKHFELYQKENISYRLLWFAVWTPRVLCINISDYNAGVLTVYCNFRMKINSRIFKVLQNYCTSKADSEKLKKELGELFDFVKQGLVSKKYKFTGISREELAKRYRKEQRIAKAKEYIDKHYKEKITLNQISELIGLAPQYFCNIFHELWGYSYYEYIIHLRLKEAVGYFRDSGLNVSQVGEKVGYNSVPIFSRVFKKYLGKSPSDYRKDILSSKYMEATKSSIYK